jgi:ELWxxDGT repeat protein
LYFAADDGVHGNELWRSDGTAAGTVLVKDIFPGVSGSNPTDLTLSGGHLFFAANDGAHGVELWDPMIPSQQSAAVEVVVTDPATSSPLRLFTMKSAPVDFTTGATIGSSPPERIVSPRLQTGIRAASLVQTATRAASGPAWARGRRLSAHRVALDLAFAKLSNDGLALDL